LAKKEGGNLQQMRIRNGIFSFSVNIVCIALLVGNIIYLVAVWSSLPDQIPGHYDFAGNVTRYDGRGTLLVVPIINWILFLGISLVELFPNIWNTGVKVTAENRARVYRILRNMIVTLKFSVVVSFLFLSVNQTLGGSLPGWYTPALLSLMFVPMIFFIVKLFRAR